MNAKDLFRERLVQRMDAVGKASIDLSRDVGVTPSTILKYRNGTALPSLDALVRIARSLNCSIDHLLGLTDLEGNPEIPTESLTGNERELISLLKDQSVEEQRRILEILRLIIRKA